MATEQLTIGQWLEQLAVGDTSTESDSTRMQNLLHKVGFPQAVVVVGIVYPRGRGTAEFPPVSINFMAQVLVRKVKAHR